MRRNVFIIIFLLIGSICYSQGIKESSVKDKNNTNKQTSKLVYQKIVHFTVKQDRKSEFSKWIRENQKEFAESLPTGWKFLGCFYTMFHMGRHQWQFRYEIQGMSAYDNLVLSENEKLDILLDQIYDFIDGQIPMETEILKEIKSDKQEIEKDK